MAIAGGAGWRINGYRGLNAWLRTGGCGQKYRTEAAASMLCGGYKSWPAAAIWRNRWLWRIWRLSNLSNLEM